MLWVSLQPIDTNFANVVDAADGSWMYEVENFILNYTVGPTIRICSFIVFLSTVKFLKLITGI